MIRLPQRLAGVGLTRRPQPRSAIDFGAWLPDLPIHNNPGLTVAENVLPHQASYRPFPGFGPFSDALTARCQGSATVKAPDGNIYVYSGDATKLYRLVSGAQTDASGATYSCDAEERWEFVRWGDQAFACNIDDAVQEITLGGATFADLFTSTLKPQARHMAIVRDFLVLGHVEEGGTRYENRLRWSALGDPTDMDQDAATQSDFQDLESSSDRAGAIQGIVGREYGIVFQEQSIWRMTYVGSPAIFQFDEVETGRGAFVSGAIAAYGRFVFYLSEDGFYLFDGTQSTPIGHEQINDTFFKDFDLAFRTRMTSAVFPNANMVVWSYPGLGNNAGLPNRILIYNWVEEKWTRITYEHELIMQNVLGQFTLETLDSVAPALELLPFSLDSAVYQGVLAVLAAFDTSHQLGAFIGAPLDAVLETGEREAFQHQRALPVLVRPLVEGSDDSTITVQIGYRDELTEDVTWSTARSPNANGECEFRDDNIEARYHRIRLNVTGTFTEVHGVEIEGTARGWQ